MASGQATSEPTRQRDQSPSRDTPMASGQPAVQTFVLRVSIHCHGCKKKVRKVLKSIEGVQDVKVDAQRHKVMVTGTVDAETLVKRLYKSGKQALPWQHTPAKNPEAPAPAPPAEDGSKDVAAADKKPAEPVKEPQADRSDKKPEKKPETEKEAESEKQAEKEEAKPSDEAKKDGGEGPATEPKAKDTKEAGNNDEGEAKKKQSKPDDAPAADRSLSPAPAPAHAHQEFNPYSAPQPVMSHHMAQPRASVSYYAPQPEQGYYMRQQPPQPQPGYSSLMQHPPPQQAQAMQQWSPSYLYMPYPHASPESYYQDYYSPPVTHAPPPPPPPLQDSYRLFDDENPNSCSVM